MKCINKNDEKIIRSAIIQELKILKFNFRTIGTRYMLDIIYLLYTLEMYKDFSLKSDIYPVIGNKYGRTANSVKSAVVYATDKMVFDCNEEFLLDYLGEEEFFDEEDPDSKPGPKKVIVAILKRIKNI